MLDSSINIGVICGRFQPFHLGHAELLCSVKARCRKLLVGITNPDSESWVESAGAPHRHLEESNPFTYFERMEMIRAALPELGIVDNEVAFVPFPLLNPQLLKFYVPKEACIFVAIYKPWGAARFERIRSEGFKVEILSQRTESERITSGSQIRAAICNKESWRQFVPKSTAQVIEAIILRRQL